ncbi:MAG: hypothetical protein RJQ09_08785 [Cyclobacteriaceae bacterium]
MFNHRIFIRSVSKKIISFLGLAPLKDLDNRSARYINTHRNILIEDYLNDHLHSSIKYTESKRLNRFEYNIYSQNGEDGIIEEIFNRIKIGNKIFIEFGVHGSKNNTTLLLNKGWKGLWIEATKSGYSYIKKKFHNEIYLDQLKIVKAFVTQKNVESLFTQSNIPNKFDFLSIDIDGNDYWIWKEINSFRPRVVQIEYNAVLRSDLSWVMPYDSDHIWAGGSYFGASLKALEKLGKEKNYSLIACDFSGTNAFFVSNDEDLELFESPFTAQNHYEPPRYFLQRETGHRVDYGPYLDVK